MAASGMEALAILNSGSQFELVLTDLMMSELDGMGLLQKMRVNHPDTPVIMVTAVHDVGVALKAIRDGAYDYLLKPFERDQLLAAVRRALETRRLKQENLAYQNGLKEMIEARTAQLHQAMIDLERSYDTTLAALGDALDLKDAETEGHSRRVTVFTHHIATAMNLSEDKIRVIARGAFLHDIGKMAIPDAILRKPGALTPDEQEIMRSHCKYGYDMLRKISFLTEAAEIVYAHQERYDGSGYPRGLKGSEIVMGARIFAIADALDAITSDRPYRSAQTINLARNEIRSWGGRQFDPEVVQVFLDIPEQTWLHSRQEIDEQIHSQSRDAMPIWAFGLFP
jgi:putative nucleotidyltransferase with HDIG domain